MPTFKTYSDEKNIYSVDMMMAYVNLFKPKTVNFDIEENLWQIEQNVWGDYSPVNVLQHPDKKKYAENIKRIHDADLSYPIFITAKGQIIDGYHRILKAIKKKEKTVKAYVIDAVTLKKCILHKGLDYSAVHQHMDIHTILELFYKRFCSS